MMNDKLATEIKKIYSKYHAGEMNAETALDELELLFADDYYNE